MSDTSPVQYWYNTKTGKVEESRDRSSWSHRMGPYPSREAAERALDSAARRNEDWDGEDADWRGGRD
ncbi:SPOR domain-containing protein [Promicromonospora sp. Marseille-Q5078]